MQIRGVVAHFDRAQVLHGTLWQILDLDGVARFSSPKISIKEQVPPDVGLRSTIRLYQVLIEFNDVFMSSYVITCHNVWAI